MLAATMAYMAAMAESSDTKTKEIWKEEQRESKEVIPNGCKKYYFTKSGEYFTEKPNGYEIVFECIAINNKSAIKKFNAAL